MQGVRQLEDAANRASVVIYSIDPRGLRRHFNSAPPDNTGHMSPRQIARVPQMRATQEFRSQDGMVMLARDDLRRASFRTPTTSRLRYAKPLQNTEGYHYLLGYHPDASTFDVSGRPKFHGVKVKLVRAPASKSARAAASSDGPILLHEPKPGRPAG